MSKLTVTLLSFALVACSSNNTSKSNYQYNLVKNRQILSQYTNLNDCEGAAIRKNIRTINEFNSKYKSYQRVTSKVSTKLQTVCSKI